jgi:hypothetical protein
MKLSSPCVSFITCCVRLGCFDNILSHHVFHEALTRDSKLFLKLCVIQILCVIYVLQCVQKQSSLYLQRDLNFDFPSVGSLIFVKLRKIKIFGKLIELIN